MPLVVLTGSPLSGKTRVAHFLKLNFDRCIAEQKLSYECRILHEADYMTVTDLNLMYTDAALEKQLRGAMKAAVEKALSKSCILILDAMNYIKGQRYEIYCIAKACRTTSCTVLCACASRSDTDSIAADADAHAAKEPAAYRQDVLHALDHRYEPPDGRNRWDQPLFTVTDDAHIPFDEICSALLNRKPPPPNQSTQLQPVSTADFVQEFDRATKQIVDDILQYQQLQGDNTVCGSIKLPGREEPLAVSRKFGSAELARLRRQFLAYSRSRPVAELAKQDISTLFVQYLSQSMT